MTASRKHEIRVGLATVLAIVVVVGGVIWGKGAGLGVSNRVVKMNFPNAAGLDVGAPVTLNGVRKGSVTALDARADGVTVTAVVENSVPLKSDAQAFLTMQELTGGKVIGVVPGKAEAPLPENAVINGEVRGDITALLSDLGNVSKAVPGMLARVDSIVGVLNAVVGTPEFKGEIAGTLANLQSGSAAARDLVVGNRAAIDRIVSNADHAVTDLRAIIAETRPTLDTLLAATTNISGDAKTTLQKLQGTLAHADSLVTSVGMVINDVRNGKGAVSKLLYDENFSGQIDSTLKAVRRLLYNIDRRGFNVNIGLGGKE
ncbi:MAG TPA: MlaD family protein [Candidatus Kapabacteria bacterium]|nr:MlaD family protein [Candidatus Kapabacteria bacterium]